MIVKTAIGDICNISSAGDKPSIFEDVKTEKCNIPVIANGVDNDGVVGYTDKAKITTEAVTVSARGNVGTSFYRNEPYYPVIRLLTITPKNWNEVNCRYLYYLLKNSPLQGIGSVQAQLTVPDVSKMEVFFESDYIKQTYIADFLATVDSKIANNNAICSNLESMAKLLYDYWFVQFDFPDENGKPYKSSGGKMVWCEELNREIPESWEVNTLSSVISSSKNGDWGSDTAKKPDDIEVRCFRGADFPSITNDYHVTAPIRYISKKNSSRLLEPGDLVTEISGGSPTQATGRIGYINQKFLNRSGFDMDCSNFCKAFTPVSKEYQYWLYQTWMMLYKLGAMFNYESKTTGIKNLMFDEFVSNIKVTIPKNKLLVEYHNIVSCMYDKIQDYFAESEKLASLRDFLLPMLMNGQIKIGE